MVLNLVILGPPGAGKGTMASRVSEKLDLKHVATGDILRRAMDEGTEAGKKAEGYISAGKPVPNEIMTDIIIEHIQRPECENGFILDTPYNRGQAEAVGKVKDIDAAINLVISEDIVIQRLSTRRICGECGEVYNIEILPPKEEGVCDKCGGELIQRKDDRPEAIRERLRQYHQRAQPLVDYYNEEGKLANVEITEASAPPEVNVQKVLDALMDKVPGKVEERMGD